MVTESQLAPGRTEAVNVVAALEATPTPKDPEVLPGGLPVTELKIAPAGESVMTALAVTSSVTGTVARPAEVTTEIELL